LQSVPISLTSLEAMWLLDLRERPEENQQKQKQDQVAKKSSKRTSVTPKPRTNGYLNTKNR